LLSSRNSDHHRVSSIQTTSRVDHGSIRENCAKTGIVVGDTPTITVRGVEGSHTSRIIVIVTKVVVISCTFVEEGDTHGTGGSRAARTINTGSSYITNSQARIHVVDTFRKEYKDNVQDSIKRAATNDLNFVTSNSPIEIVNKLKGRVARCGGGTSQGSRNTTLVGS
jgi:hypothetical protein